MRVDLPSGNWIELRDIDSLTRADRKEMLRRSRSAAPTAAPTDATEGDEATSEANFEAGLNIDDAMLATVIVAWSYDFPLPATRDALDAIPLADDAVLLEVIVPYRDRFIVDFTPKRNGEGKLDPKALSSL